MLSMRRFQQLVAVLALTGGACSAGSSTPSGSGGTPGTGGLSTTGGTIGTVGTGGHTGSEGSGGSGPSGTGGTTGTTATGGTAPGGTGGGSASGGAAGTGGGTGSGGRSSSGGAGGAAASGGRGQGSGGSSAGGSSGSAGAGGSAPSAGCGQARTLQNGTLNITVSNASRKYILRVPDGYVNTQAYRLVFAFAESGSSASSVASRNYFTLSTMDNKNTIFVAPEAVGGAGSWSNGDVAFTDAILAQLEGDLCIDKTRVFATGFSFGGGMAMALACTRADVFRAVAFFSGADLTNSCPKTLTKPIAYYASQASEDSGGMPATSAITGEKKQAEFAAINGCTAEPSSTTFPTSGKPHTCTNYKGCSAGHPTEYCVFYGPHGWEPKDPGQSTSWDAPEAWKFITQF